MDETTVGLTILGMGVVTYLPRLLPLLILRRRAMGRGEMSPYLEAWLQHVAASGQRLRLIQHCRRRGKVVSCDRSVSAGDQTMQRCQT